VASNPSCERNPRESGKYTEATCKQLKQRLSFNGMNK